LEFCHPDFQSPQLSIKKSFGHKGQRVMLTIDRSPQIQLLSEDEHESKTERKFEFQHTTYHNYSFPVQVLTEFQVETVDSVVDFIRKKIELNTEESFNVVNLGAIVKQFHYWHRLLPRVQPFYAIKCNPDISFLRILANLGAGFDCASKEEIRLVKDCGVDSSRIIYANPCKSRIHINKAKQEGIKMMTFDNLDELHKIHLLYPEAELVLRILPDDSCSLMKFGSKFGAPEEIWDELLQEASNLELNVIGISFHVGSGCYDSIGYVNSLRLARKTFDVGLKYGYDFTLLDIGGGFPGNENSSPTFMDIAKLVGPLIDELFPPSVRVISEPGRFFAASTTLFVTSIHSRRAFQDGETKRFKYYIGDGVYGAFNCILFDHAKPLPRLPFLHESENLYHSTIFGPTCDSMDTVVSDVLLPELSVGDWLYFEDMGAYTSAAASKFNGFLNPQSLYILEKSFSVV
jgi:ornithine decarboxylase